MVNVRVMIDKMIDKTNATSTDVNFLKMDELATLAQKYLSHWWHDRVQKWFSRTDNDLLLPITSSWINDLEEAFLTSVIGHKAVVVWSMTN